MQILTNQEIDQKLINRNILRIEDCIYSTWKIKWKCLNSGCNYIWDATPRNIIKRNQGCPKCSKTLKLTQEEIDKRLTDKKIERLENFISGKAKMQFKCLVQNCNYIWYTTIYNLNRGAGCPKCNKNLSVNNENIDAQLMSTNIKRLGNIINSHNKIEWQCLNENCKNIWITTASKIIHTKSGCPNCSAGRNERLVGEILTKNNIIYEKQYNLQKINSLEEKRYLADYYLSFFKIIIEYNGKQHYQPVNFGGISDEQAKANLVKQQARDLYLQNFCNQNKIKLIWIDGRKYKNSKLESYIINEIVPNLE